MSNLRDELIENIKNASAKYQELLLLLMQGKASFVPSCFVDEDKARLSVLKVFEQFLEHPEKAAQANIDYLHKLQNLVQNAITKFTGGNADDIFKPSEKDKRFKDKAWQENAYFDFIKQFYLLNANWIEENIKQYQLEPELEDYVKFTTKQFIDAFAPSNFVFSNPEVMRESLSSGMGNIVKGLDNFLRDIKKSGELFSIPTTDTGAFQKGKNIAATEGKVVMQNKLCQLICYKPKEQVYSVPLLIIPPWINKYYILDLSSHNSMVKFLVDSGFQIFMVSWVNPDSSFADTSFEDYLKYGVLESCEYITSLGYSKINAAGYCIGGTLLAIAAAYMKSANIEYLNNLSFITTLLDFVDPGEIKIFINQSTIGTIEQEMNKTGYFDGRYLSNSFSLLRANDLIWSFFVNNYLLGKSPMPFDLLYWNADATNLPAKMHSYYLRNMYLKNNLKEPNALSFLDQPIDLGKIDHPAFFVAAQDDHIAPWKAVYDGVKLLSGDRTFCLTSSGHVAGVVNPPATSKYHYRVSATTNNDSKFKSNNCYAENESETWLQNSNLYNGSWWNMWNDWLKSRSGKLKKPINYNKLPKIEDAPGSYIK